MKNTKDQNKFSYSELSSEILKSIDLSSDWLLDFYDEKGYAFYNVYKKKFENNYQPLESLVFQKGRANIQKQTKTKEENILSFKERITKQTNEKMFALLPSTAITESSLKKLSFIERFLLRNISNSDLSLVEIVDMFSKLNQLKINITITEPQTILESYNILFKILFQKLEKINPESIKDSDFDFDGFLKKLFNIISLNTFYCLIQFRVSSELKDLFDQKLFKNIASDIVYYPFKNDSSSKKEFLLKEQIVGLRYNPIYQKDRMSLKMSIDKYNVFFDRLSDYFLKKHSDIISSDYQCSYDSFLEKELITVLQQFDFYKNLSTKQHLILTYAMLNKKDFDDNDRIYRFNYRNQDGFFQGSKIIFSFLEKEIIYNYKPDYSEGKNDYWITKIFKSELSNDSRIHKRGITLSKEDNIPLLVKELFFNKSQAPLVKLNIEDSFIEDFFLGKKYPIDNSFLEDILGYFGKTLYLDKKQKETLSFLLREKENLSYINNKLQINYDKIQIFLSQLNQDK